MTSSKISLRTILAKCLSKECIPLLLRKQPSTTELGFPCRLWPPGPGHLEGKQDAALAGHKSLHLPGDFLRSVFVSPVYLLCLPLPLLPSSSPNWREEARRNMPDLPELLAVTHQEREEELLTEDAPRGSGHSSHQEWSQWPGMVTGH